MLDQWLIEQNPTLLSGMAILEGSIDNNQALENIELTLEVAEYGVLTNQESSFHGTVLYSDSIVSTVDPVMLIIGESILSIDGELNLKTKELNFIPDLEKVNKKVYILLNPSIKKVDNTRPNQEFLEKVNKVHIKIEARSVCTIS